MLLKKINLQILAFLVSIPGSARNSDFRGGGGVTLFFVVKLDFEIAVVQQTKAQDRTFEVVPDSGCQPVSAGQPRPYLVNF